MDKRKQLRELFEALMRECFTQHADPEMILLRYSGKLARLKQEWAR